MISRLIGVVVAVLFAGTAVAAPAAAHTELTGSVPAAGASVAPPTEIVLTYASGVMLPQVVVRDAAGNDYAAGQPVVEGAKVRLTLRTVLGGGPYTVSWRVVASDGHPVAGTYDFIVQGASAPAQQPVAAAPSKEGRPMWHWFLAGALALAVIGGALAWARSTLR